MANTSVRDASTMSPDPVDTCAICLDPFGEEHLAVDLPCGHTFGSICIEEWFKSKNVRAKSCPVCRRIRPSRPSQLFRDFSSLDLTEWRPIFEWDRLDEGNLHLYICQELESRYLIFRTNSWMGTFQLITRQVTRSETIMQFNRGCVSAQVDIVQQNDSLAAHLALMLATDRLRRSIGRVLDQILRNNADVIPRQNTVNEENTSSDS